MTPLDEVVVRMLDGKLHSQELRDVIDYFELRAGLSGDCAEFGRKKCLWELCNRAHQRGTTHSDARNALESLLAFE